MEDRKEANGAWAPLANKVALVTGASRGIGAAIVKVLGELGAVVVGTATSEKGAAEIEGSLAAAGIQGRGIVLDVVDAPGCAVVMQSLQKELGGVSILVNNAGITRDHLAIRLKEADWQTVIDTNLSAVFRLSKLAALSMSRAGYGRIINVSSVVASLGNVGQANYAAAKAGVEGLSRVLANEMARRQVTVNCVAPGLIDTDMTRDLPNRDALLTKIPAGRIGEPWEIAQAVAFLAGPGAAYITGVTLHVNGGLYMG